MRCAGIGDAVTMQAGVVIGINVTVVVGVSVPGDEGVVDAGCGEVARAVGIVSVAVRAGVCG